MKETRAYLNLLYKMAEVIFPSFEYWCKVR